MTTPVRGMLEGYIGEGRARFHMPGHKGNLPGPLEEAAAYDITEVAGADSLFECSGVLRRCEEGLARLFGARESLISCGGSTLCIQAMLAMAARPGGKILFSRNIHRAALHAMILLDIHPVWIYPEQPAVGFGPITPRQVEAALKQDPQIQGVYITSPDYYGCMLDVEGIAHTCRWHDVPLLVDNAHGAHLGFLEENRHPMALGADLCCDSLHKTLPALTGSALLHIGSPRFTWEQAKEVMGLFGSTSPSYLTMLSIDMLLEDPQALRDGIRQAAETVEGLTKLARFKGFRVLGEDPLKLTLGPGGLGLTGEAYAQVLRENGMEPEYADRDWVVLMASSCTAGGEWIRLRDHLQRARGRQDAPGILLPDGCIPGSAVPMEGDWDLSSEVFRHPQAALTPRAAYFAPKAHIPTLEAQGRIYAEIRWPCPPAIPLIMPGEIMDKKICEMLNASGKTDSKVVQ